MAYPEPMTEVTAAHRRGILLTVALILTLIAILVGGFVYTMSKPRVLSDAQLRANNAFLFDSARDIGDFSLVDDNGKPFTPADLRGKWSLLYFGYTYCPDICPTTMALLSRFYYKLEPKYARDTQVVMVSVDPARDNAAKLHDYVHYFNPQFRGVTGEFLALEKFASTLNAPFQKTPGDGDHYEVSHSGNIAIVNPAGQYIGFFKTPHKLAKLLTNYRSIRVSHN